MKKVLVVAVTVTVTVTVTVVTLLTGCTSKNVSSNNQSKVEQTSTKQEQKKELSPAEQKKAYLDQVNEITGQCDITLYQISKLEKDFNIGIETP